MVKAKHDVDVLEKCPTGIKGLDGSARAAQEAKERASEVACRREADRRLREQERKRKALEEKIAALRAEFDAETEEVHLIAEEERKRQSVLTEDRLDMAHLRRGKPSALQAKGSKKEGKESKVNDGLQGKKRGGQRPIRQKKSGILGFM
jgi:hypothetical protein